jgi:hypothetical protein
MNPSSIFTFIESLPHDIQGWFTKHNATIQTSLSVAQSALTVLGAVATAEGAPPALALEAAKVVGGLTAVGATVTAVANAGTLLAASNAVTGLATTLVNNGLINVKNPSVVAAVDTAVVHVTNVATLLSVAAQTASQVK